MGRCTGHCCRRFNLSVTYSDLMTMRDKLRNGQYVGYLKEEVEKIADMLIPLGTSSLDMNGQTMVDDGHGNPNVFKPKQIGEIVVMETEWFTCRHFNQETGNCMDYENRPKMCMEHGIAKKCAYDACTYKNFLNSSCEERKKT